MRFCSNHAQVVVIIMYQHFAILGYVCLPLIYGAIVLLKQSYAYLISTLYTTLRFFICYPPLSLQLDLRSTSSSTSCPLFFSFQLVKVFYLFFLRGLSYEEENEVVEDR